MKARFPGTYLRESASLSAVICKKFSHTLTQTLFINPEITKMQYRIIENISSKPDEKTSDRVSHFSTIYQHLP